MVVVVVVVVVVVGARARTLYMVQKTTCARVQHGFAAFRNGLRARELLRRRGGLRESGGERGHRGGGEFGGDPSPKLCCFAPPPPPREPGQFPFCLGSLLVFWFTLVLVPSFRRFPSLS